MFQLFDFINKKFLPATFKTESAARGQILLMNILNRRSFVNSTVKNVFVEYRYGKLNSKIGIVKLAVAN